VLGWSTEVTRFTEGDDDLDEQLDDADVRFRRRIGFEGESPDGRSVGLWVQPGEPTPPDEAPDDPTDERWRIRIIGVDAPYGLTLEENAHRLGVHEVPEEQSQSVLLYVDGATASFLLDDGELEPGAAAEGVDLAALGIESEAPPSTGLVVHFDEDGQALAAEGGTISEPPPAPEADETPTDEQAE
jgi:hypothetical protein